MKHFLLYVSTLLILLSLGISAQVICSPDSVVKIESSIDLYRYGDIYIGGQPTKSMFTWLKSEGMTQVINLRTSRENRQHSMKYFSEKAYLDSLGISYLSVPIGGGKAKNGDDKLEKVSKVLNSGEKVLMHCKSGARARYILAVYLVREKNCPEESATQIAKEMGYYFPLELLFKNEVKMDTDTRE